MIGLHTIIFNPNNNLKITESDFSEILHEDNFKIKIVKRTAKCVIAISYYEGYPFIEWQDADNQIILEGMIYNLSKEEIRTKLNEISFHFARDYEYEDLVKRFVETADGDYIVQIWQNTEGRLLIFNDYLGRLPLYYYCQDGLYVFSRELKIILQFIPRISFNKLGLTEFLMFEYTLGNKTIFKDVFRLDPSKIIIADMQAKNKRLKIVDSADFSFILKEPFMNKKESIDSLKSAFIESVENRVKTLEQNEYRIISDLSGGYDSRTVLAGLSRFTDDVSYFTDEYKQDESLCARDVFLKMGSPGIYHKLSYDNTFNLNGMNTLIYKTNGLVNCYTTSVCYKDSRYRKEQLPGIIARFLGLGGEFIRHPFKLSYHSLLYGLEKEFYSTLPLDTACKMVNLSPNTYKEDFEKYLDTLPEKTLEDQLRRFYYEYYNHYVGAAGEERHRIHFWTVDPMWNSAFLRTIFSRIPLDWIGYKYYIQFMKALDPRLLKSPIYKSDIRLESNLSVNIHETLDRLSFLKSKILLTIKDRLPVIYNSYKLLSYRKRTEHSSRNDVIEELHHYYDNLAHARDLFDLPTIVENLSEDIDYYRAVTLLIYIGEIERRFGNKMS